jgi:demethylmenaquinone methyltransferase/2-methoxy-6-polyprenyl-1,4-benzoquinol methylase
METREFFNKLAEKWDEINHYEMDKIETMINLLNIKNGEQVLDVGTGTGVLLPLLFKRTSGESITAIDLSDKMMEQARKKFADTSVHFINADVIEYPFEKEFFDHIICYSVFPHLEKKSAAIKHFSAALKSGGLLSVLHSSPKEKINGVHIHAHSREINSDYLLPAMDYVPFLNKNGLREEIIIDNSALFMFSARKQWRRDNR